MRGEDSDDAETAGNLVAETFLWWRAWLRSRMKTQSASGKVTREIDG